MANAPLSLSIQPSNVAACSDPQQKICDIGKLQCCVFEQTSTKIDLQFDYKYFKPELFIKQSSAFKYFRNSRFFLSFHFPFPTILFLKEKEQGAQISPVPLPKKESQQCCTSFSFFLSSQSEQTKYLSQQRNQND